jgi:biogenesis of lysosome-related organelles complex 1 subunit 2
MASGGASPRRKEPTERVGPTLSTSTSSFEALDPHDPQLNHLASLMFNKTADWITSELQSTSDDYKLVQQMNEVTASKYSDMQQITGNIAKGVNQLNDKYRELQPYLDQIDQIGESVARLEQAAFKLDSYSKRLESKYKDLEKRNN